jgi:hypothetical protein
MLTRRSRVVPLWAVLLLLLLCTHSRVADASHFRYGTVTWERASDTSQKVRFLITSGTCSVPWFLVVLVGCYSCQRSSLLSGRRRSTRTRARAHAHLHPHTRVHTGWTGDWLEFKFDKERRTFTSGIIVYVVNKQGNTIARLAKQVMTIQTENTLKKKMECNGEDDNTVNWLIATTEFEFDFPARDVYMVSLVGNNNSCCRVADYTVTQCPDGWDPVKKRVVS